MRALFVAVAWFCATIAPAGGDDWPEWRGPRRDGISRETDWLLGWPRGEPPQLAWRAAVGRGHSAVAVSQGRVYTLGWDGSLESIFCLDALSGRLIWRQSYECATLKQWPGPRSTPTVRDKRVFTLGQHGHALCCDAQTGDKIWSRQLPARYNPDVDYGFAWSPLLVRDHLVFCAGRRGLALRARDGAMAWGDDGVAGSCASAVPFGSQPGAGVALVVNNQRESVSLVGVHPITGEVQWRSGEWPEKWGAACIDPLVVGNRVLLTTAEQFPQAARFTIEGGKVSQDWVNAGFACYTGGCVFIKDCVFGVTRDGILKCIDWETGRMHWGQRGFDRHGALMAADGMLIIQASSSGELVVARAEAGGYEELRRYQVFPQESSSFTVPVLANGQLFCRSYAGELVCLNLAPGAAE